MQKLVPLYRRPPKRSLSPSTVQRHRERMVIYEQGSGLSPDTELPKARESLDCQEQTFKVRTQKEKRRAIENASVFLENMQVIPNRMSTKSIPVRLRWK